MMYERPVRSSNISKENRCLQERCHVFRCGVHQVAPTPGRSLSYPTHQSKSPFVACNPYRPGRKNLFVGWCDAGGSRTRARMGVIPTLPVLSTKACRHVGCDNWFKDWTIQLKDCGRYDRARTPETRRGSAGKNQPDQHHAPPPPQLFPSGP
ncbi:hypothetical protein ABW19_dt0203348 [Dactylella cylindrospora]|nr:hypothetical protein ABW19_dt0203348 [Dactylella cylindrospora]